MSDQDKGLVKKGTVRKIILKELIGYEMKDGELKEQAAGHGDYLYFEDIEKAIDALEPVAETKILSEGEGVQDAVSRDHVWWAYRNYFGVQYPSDDGFCKEIKKLPAVLPVAESRRSEEEIREIRTKIVTKIEDYCLHAEELRSTGQPDAEGKAERWYERARDLEEVEESLAKLFAPSVQDKEKEEPGGKD